jgi:A/G-specific adenine glycosylase
MAYVRPTASTEDMRRATLASAPLEQWYRGNGRDFPWRHWRDEYRLIVVEVLLQRTSARVIASFERSFFARFGSWQALSSAGTEELEDVLRPIGLQQRRASTLVSLAIDFQKRPLAPLGQRPGIGQYIERAVEVARDSARLAMVDTNFIRVVRRLAGPAGWMADYRHDPRLQAIALQMVATASNPRVLNWAVLDLGAQVCRPRKPNCEACPIRDYCSFGSAVDES